MTKNDRYFVIENFIFSAEHRCINLQYCCQLPLLQTLLFSDSLILFLNNVVISIFVLQQITSKLNFLFYFVD